MNQIVQDVMSVSGIVRLKQCRRRMVKVIVDEDKCIGCFCCDEVCNYKAIEMKRTFLGRAFLKMAVFSGCRETAVDIRVK